MFDFGWIELLIIGLVMVLVLGPKELPHAMRSIAKAMRKARRLAAEFQGHFDDMLRETELDEVKKQVDQLKRTNLSNEIEKAIDPGGEIKRDLNETLAAADPSKVSKETNAPKIDAPVANPVDPEQAANPATPANDEAKPAAKDA